MKITDKIVTSDTSCPAVLIENLFQDNKAEVQYLLSEESKRNIIELHLEAIKKLINN